MKLPIKLFANGLKKRHYQTYLIITLKMVNSTYIDKLIIEDVEASLPSIQGSNATLKIEAEDMDRTGGYQKTFADDSNKKFIWCGSGEASFKAEAGTYLLQVGCFSRFGNKLTVTINDGTTLEVLPSKYWTDSTALTSMTSDAVEIHEYPVTLNEGKNTISISFTNNAALDYIVISNVADYHKEVYSYSLKDANIRTGRRWGMVESYLGEYNVNDDSSWQTTLPNTTTKALSKADVSHVYYPFETTVDSDYYVKVTYASAEASKAVVIVDPTDPATTLPYKSSDTWDYDAVGGTKIENGTWQSTYSGSEGTFTAPYFTEKIFYIGKLSGGSHNLAFVVNPDQTENKGVAIRKVELISSDNIENEIYFTTAQMIAENVGAEVQTSALVTTPEAANTFSSASAADDDKNTAATVGYVYNYTDDTLEFVYITASYNDDLLVDAVMSEVIPVAPGADANLKAKVSTIGATGVVTYIWEAGTLVPIKEVTPFDY